MVFGKRSRGWRVRGGVLAVSLGVVALVAGSAFATQRVRHAAAPQINRNATISAGYAIGAASTLDPAFVPIDYVFSAPIYDRLLRTPTTESGLYPSLATSWTFSNHGRALTFVLRSGEVFHDGSPVDAAAVKANIIRYKTLQGSVWTPELAPIKSISVVGKYKVRLNLVPGEGRQLPRVFSTAPGMIINPKYFKANLATDPPVGAGSGPYVFSSSPNANEFIFKRYKGKHGTAWEPGSGDAAELRLFVVADAGATTIDDIKSGTLDVGLVDVSGLAQAEALIKSDPSQYAGKVFTSPDLSRLLLNPKIPPFNNTLLRQAVQAAINPQAIARAISPGGKCTVSEQPVSPADPTFDKNFVNTNPYSVAQAKADLAKAGMPNGFSFTVDSPTFAVFPIQSEEIQAELAQVGIHMTINPIAPTAFGADLYGGKWQAYSWGANAEDPDIVDGLFSNLLTGGPDVTQGTPLASRANSYLKELSSPTLSNKAYITDSHQLYEWLNNQAIEPIFCAQQQIYLHKKDIINADSTMPSGEFDQRFYGELK